MQGPIEFDYQAFVSYRHKPEDSAFAQWLVEAIETFETPERLQQEGYPAKIGKVFRDDDELRAEPELTPAIKMALWKSKYLLVICSEDTPKSAWVRAEISLFQHWGRADRIIPVLINGTPDTSFPPELVRTKTVGEGLDAEVKQIVPRGPDLTQKQAQTEEEAKLRAQLTIAATMLGCAFSSLKDRVEERIKKSTSFEYFREMTRKRGAPFGVGAISQEQAGQLNMSYRFESRGGRVVRVQRQNGHGYPNVNDDGIGIFDFVYRDDGSVEQVNHRNRNEVVKLRERFNHDQTILDFIHEDDSASPTDASASAIGFAASDLNSGIASKSTILRHILTYDENGFVIEARYCRDTFNTPGRDGLGHYGQGFERNSVGQSLREWALDATSQPVTQKNGIRFKVAKYNEDGLKTEEAYYDESASLVLHKNGFARFTASYDARGNRVEEAYFGVDGEPVLHKDGFARGTASYDARGNRVEVAYFGVDGEPVLHKDGFARGTVSYDARGNRVEVAYFGVDGAPVLHKDGFARFTVSYDARGNRVDVAYFGVDGEPVLDKDGVARFTVSYDARGNRVEVAYFGVDGAPVLHKNGFARFTASYDARGNRVEEAYFGVDGEPVLHKDGFARFTTSYDARGKAVEVAYFGVDGAPVLHKDGFARGTVSYDARGNRVDVAYFGVDGAPVLHKDGFSRFTTSYDARGKAVEVAYFGFDGAPVLHKDAVARFTSSYDARGNIVEQAYFGVDGEPVLHKDGYARFTSSYDARGNTVEEAYFGVDGAPVLHKDGFSRFTVSYDARGNTVEEAYFGVDGAPVLHKDGFSRFTVSYDARGNRVEVAYFGVDGAPVLHKDGFARFTSSYDARGNRVEVAYFGVDGAPVLHKDGFARFTSSYDARGNRVEVAYFDANNNPINRRGEWSGDESLGNPFGDWQNLVIRGLLDETDREQLTKTGFAKIVRKLDDRQNEINRQYFDNDGNPVPGPEGFSSFDMDVNAFGQPLQVRPLLMPDGPKICIRFAYTERRLIDRVQFEDVDGKLTTSKLGFASLHFLYDEKFDQTGVEYRDADGNIIEQ